MPRPSRPFPARSGFTLIELMVVMLIIAVLIAILIPAVNAARTAARNTSSRNNLKQIALANAHYEVAHLHFPPSWQAPVSAPTGSDVEGWSIFALLLPHLEMDVIKSKIDFNVGYNNVPNVVTADGTSTKLSALRVPTYLSPGEPRDEVRFESGVAKHYPLNYAANLGTWLVWDPNQRIGGDGMAYPNSKLKSGDFRDGMSSTLAFAEVKAWQAYYRNAGVANPTMPTSAADIVALGGEFKTNTGHTEWVDGRVHQIGFTTVFPPNARVLTAVSGAEYDLDWTNWQEGKGLNGGTTNPTYAAVTARSYFAGAVNVAMMDGSVRPINDNINLGVWRAISTRKGGEILPDEFAK